MKAKNVVIPVSLDPKTKKEFHGLCIQHGDTMTEVLRECVKNYIDAHKPRYMQIS